MRPRCSVCENFRAETEIEADQKLVELSFDARTVLLCVGHARIAQNSGVTSFEALRALYGTGRRSFVPRRDPNPIGSRSERRRGIGRRQSDARS